MIHSSAAMPTGNFDVSPSPETPPRARVLPAEYYEAPVDESRRLVPRWMVFGCGGAAALALLVMFASSFFVTKAGLGEMFDFMLSMTQSEAVRSYAADVPQASRAAYEAEVAAVRKDLKEGKLTPARLDPLLQELQSAMSDKLLRADEVERLTATAKQVRTPRVKR
jgi:hypothetical protein